MIRVFKAKKKHLSKTVLNRCSGFRGCFYGSKNYECFHCIPKHSSGELRLPFLKKSSESNLVFVVISECSTLDLCAVLILLLFLLCNPSQSWICFKICKGLKLLAVFVGPAWRGAEQLAVIRYLKAVIFDI